MEIRKGSIGDEDVARIYTGDNIVHPLPVQDGLVLWYDFMGRRNSDDKRGIAEDLSGNGNHGEFRNFAYEPGSGYEDDRPHFDGVDDYIEVPDSSAFNFEEVLTLEFLVEIAGDGSYGGFVKGDSGGWASNSYGIRSLIDRYRAYYVTGAGVVESADTGVLPRNTPVHVTASFGSTLSVYVNGSFLRSLVRSDMSIQPTEYTLKLGSAFSAAFLNGSVFSARVYNRALTPEEIAHNYAIEKERWNL